MSALAGWRIGALRRGTLAIGAGVGRTFAALAVALILAGCVSPSRLDAPPAPVAGRADPGHGALRFRVARDPDVLIVAARASMQRELAYRASTGQTGPLLPVDFLAISGGGDDGAFTAGILNGWTAHGDRPEFKVVTGVSTGALIAPFAFLGPRYDAVLKHIYTGVSQRDIFRPRNLLQAFFGDALSDTTPLYQLISHYVDRSLLAQIAAEGAKGRILMVSTTDLDTLEPIVWDMTAIAASRDPNGLALFRKVLIASAAIPGAFPPVMIDVTVDGVHYQEMHVDGGATTQVFIYPPALHLGRESAAAGAERKRTLYVIRNARLDPEWANVRRRTLPIMTRAVSALIQTQGIGDLYRIYVTTQRDGVDFNLAYIPSSFTTPRAGQFDTAYMRSLFQTGYDMAVQGYPWQKKPPGYETPFVSPSR
jgi:hypothetical protein